MRLTTTLLAILSTATSFADPREDARAAYQRGAEHMEHGEYREAIGMFEKSYLAAPHANTMFNLAQCHHELGEREKAITYYRRVVRDSDNEVLKQKAHDGLAALGASQPARGPNAQPDPWGAQPQQAAPRYGQQSGYRAPASTVPRASGPNIDWTPYMQPGLRLALAPGFWVPIGDTGDAASLGLDLVLRGGHEWMFGIFGATLQGIFEYVRAGLSSDVGPLLGVPGMEAGLNVIDFTVGGRASVHLARVAPFFEMGFGVAHFGFGEVSAPGFVSVDCDQTSFSSDQCGDTGLGIRLGFGADVGVMEKLAVGMNMGVQLGFFDDTQKAFTLNFAGVYQSPM